MCQSGLRFTTVFYNVGNVAKEWERKSKAEVDARNHFLLQPLRVVALLEFVER